MGNNEVNTVSRLAQHLSRLLDKVSHAGAVCSILLQVPLLVEVIGQSI